MQTGMSSQSTSALNMSVLPQVRVTRAGDVGAGILSVGILFPGQQSTRSENLDMHPEGSHGAGNQSPYRSLQHLQDGISTSSLISALSSGTGDGEAGHRAVSRHSTHSDNSSTTSKRLQRMFNKLPKSDSPKSVASFSKTLRRLAAISHRMQFGYDNGIHLDSLSSGPDSLSLKESDSEDMASGVKPAEVEQPAECHCSAEGRGEDKSHFVSEAEKETPGLPPPQTFTGAATHSSEFQSVAEAEDNTALPDVAVAVDQNDSPASGGIRTNRASDSETAPQTHSPALASSRTDAQDSGSSGKEKPMAPPRDRRASSSSSRGTSRTLSSAASVRPRTFAISLLPGHHFRRRHRQSRTSSATSGYSSADSSNLLRSGRDSRAGDCDQPLQSNLQIGQTPSDIEPGSDYMVVVTHGPVGVDRVNPGDQQPSLWQRVRQHFRRDRSV